MVGRLLLAALGLTLLLAAGEADAATSADRARVIELTNTDRAAAGLPALWENESLTNAAETHALSMATLNFFSHTGVDGSTLATRATTAGYTGWTWLGENIAAGQTSPESVMAAWMNSAGHRANVLSPNAREIGVGHAYNAGSPYKHYWSMELGNRVGAAPPAAPTATPPPLPTATLPPLPTATPAPSPTPIPRPLGAFRLHVPIGGR